jgi:hypothetical protein
MSSRGGGGRADLIVRLIEKRADRFAPQRDSPRGPREGIPSCCATSDKFNCCRSRLHNWIPATLSTRGFPLSHPTAGFLLHSPHRGIPVAFPMRGLLPCHPTEEFLWARRERISAASPHRNSRRGPHDGVPPRSSCRATQRGAPRARPPVAPQSPPGRPAVAPQVAVWLMCDVLINVGPLGGIGPAPRRAKTPAESARLFSFSDGADSTGPSRGRLLPRADHGRIPGNEMSALVQHAEARRRGTAARHASQFGRPFESESLCFNNSYCPASTTAEAHVV